MSGSRASFFLLLIIYLGFISLGLPDGTLGVAWPPMHTELGLPIGLAGTVIMVGTLFSGGMAFASSQILKRFTTGPVVFVSCLLTGSALMMIAHAQSLAWLLVAAVPLGLGAGAVDASLNGYVARHYSGRQMNWLHACWGIGATGGPLIMARMLGSGGGWRSGYFGISIAQLLLAVIFLLTLRLWTLVPELKRGDISDPSAERAPTTSANSVAGWLSVAIFAIYVAAEMTMGLWAGSILVVSRGIAPGSAAMCVAAYYGAITLGRIGVGCVVERRGNRRLIALGTFVALLGAVLFAFASTIPLAALALIIVGLGLAPVYPGLMHEVPKRFAPDAVQVVIGRQSGAAAIGSATFPPAAGWLAGVGLESIVWTVIAAVLALTIMIRRLDRLT